MSQFKIGSTVYQQGTFDIFKCKILEYLPDHEVWSYFGNEAWQCEKIKVDCYKVEYEDDTTAIVEAGALHKTMKDMYYV